MKILANQINKKFRQEYVIRNFNYEFNAHSNYALIGQNGSGKSTLLKILGQYSLPSKGQVQYVDHQNQLISEDQTFSKVSFVAPYIELIEEFTLTELLQFFISLNYIPKEISLSFLEDFIQLSPAKDKFIKNYSSGMRQKIKLGSALLSNRPLLFLDEPTTNLDIQAKKWFSEKVSNLNNKTIIIASNENFEIDLCQHSINVSDFKS